MTFFVAITIIFLGMDPGLSSAQTVSGSIQTVTDDRVRNSSPVQVKTIAEVVEIFKQTHQLYIVGTPQFNNRPFTPTEIKRFQDVLKNYPNAYVVLVAESQNVEADDLTLSRGIGNSPEFQSVVHPQLQERDGMIFMLYFRHYTNGQLVTKSDGSPDRKIFMRAEDLLDRLGVGEDQFGVNSSGPYGLMADYVTAFRDQGKDIPGSLEVVMQKVNARVKQESEAIIKTAETQIQDATTALNQITSRVNEFQRQYGSLGKLGSSDLAKWQAQLNQVQELLRTNKLSKVQSLSQALMTQIESLDTTLTHYTQAGREFQQVTQQLIQLEKDLEDLPNNSKGIAARNSYARAQEKMALFQSQYQAKDSRFWTNFQTAQKEAKLAADLVIQSRQDAEFIATIQKIAAGAISLSFLGILAVLHRSAVTRRQKAEIELEEALQEIGDKSTELMELLSVSESYERTLYQGKTQSLIEQLKANTVDALTLVGGARKFREKAESLIYPTHFLRRIQNLVFRHNFDEAINLLTNQQTTLRFNSLEASRDILEKGSKTDQWRDSLLQAGQTREFQISFGEVLAAMADRRDKAKAMLTELDDKKTSILTYIESVQTLVNTTKAAQMKSETRDGLFSASSVKTTLLPAIEGETGILAQARSLLTQDFISAWDDYATRAEQMCVEAEAILTLSEKAQQTLVPIVLTAKTALASYNIKTNWIQTEQQALSDTLQALVSKAVATSVAEEIQSLESQIQTLIDRIEKAIAQAKDQQDLYPNLIQKSEQKIINSRQEFMLNLKQLGVFLNGEPEDVLREPEQDPSLFIQEAHQQLVATKDSLDIGDIEKSTGSLQRIQALTEEVETIIHNTQQALKAYPETSVEYKTCLETLQNAIPVTYLPALERIQATYTAECQYLVSRDVQRDDQDKDQSIADNLPQAKQQIKDAEILINQAVEAMDKAYILTAQDQLMAAYGSISIATVKLKAICDAENILETLQKQAESELEKLEDRYRYTKERLRPHFVKKAARELWQEGRDHITNTQRELTESKQKDPYRIHEILPLIQRCHSDCEAKIAQDEQNHQDYLETTSYRSSSSSESSGSSWSSSSYSGGDSGSSGDSYSGGDSGSSGDSYSGGDSGSSGGSW